MTLNYLTSQNTICLLGDIYINYISIVTVKNHTMVISTIYQQIQIVYANCINDHVQRILNFHKNYKL